MEIVKINKSFESKKVLEDISFTLKEGEITALVGRNGAGKTTLLKIINRIIDGDAGDILIHGKSLIKNPEFQREMAFLPDRFDFFLYRNGKEAMDFYQIIYPGFDRQFVEQEAKKLHISLNKNFKNQSKGNKAMLGLLMIFASNAKYLFLDEILDGMDILNKELILKYLLDESAKGRSILISSHQIHELQGISDKVMYLDLQGRVQKFEDANTNIHKIQVVTKEDLPEDIANIAIEKNHLGRVYILLFEGVLEEIEEKLKSKEIVQYDILPIQIEDLFYVEKGKEAGNETF